MSRWVWHDFTFQNLSNSFIVISFLFIGIRALVAAIYEPPQESNRDSIKLLDDEHGKEVDEFAATLGLKKVKIRAALSLLFL